MQHRLRQHGGGHRRIAKFYQDRVAGGRRFRRDPRLGPSREDQQAAFRARLRDRGAHERVDQFLQHHLARDGLRYLDHGREVEVFDRRPDRARRAGRYALPP